MMLLDYELVWALAGAPANFTRHVSVAAPDNCWIWGASLNRPGGYGQFRVAGSRRNQFAHRTAFAFGIAPIPSGMCVMHSCDNPQCCNPAHLTIGRQADNLAEMAKRGRSCLGERNGHARLTREDVQTIRRSPASNRELAEVFGVSIQAIEDAIARRTWRHT